MSETAPVKFAGYFLEWQRIEDEKADLAGQSKDLFKAMKDEGYDTKAARVTFRDKRVELTATSEDVAKAEEAEAIRDLYRSALDEGLAARARPASARVENIEEFPSHDPETGEITQSADMAVGLAGPACAQDAAAANTKPAPIPNPQEPTSSLASGINSDEGIPAFLRKPKSPLRPHCLNPDSCAGYGSKHCHGCLKARDDATVAA